LLIQSLDLEWCITPSPTDLLMAVAIDLDNTTLPSFNTANQHITAQLGTPSVMPSAIPQLVNQLSADTQDDLTMALAVNTCLSALE